MRSMRGNEMGKQQESHFRVADRETSPKAWARKASNKQKIMRIFSLDKSCCHGPKDQALYEV